MSSRISSLSPFHVSFARWIAPGLALSPPDVPEIPITPELRQRLTSISSPPHIRYTDPIEIADILSNGSGQDVMALVAHWSQLKRRRALVWQLVVDMLPYHSPHSSELIATWESLVAEVEFLSVPLTQWISRPSLLLTEVLSLILQQLPGPPSLIGKDDVMTLAPNVNLSAGCIDFLINHIHPPNIHEPEVVYLDLGWQREHLLPLFSNGKKVSKKKLDSAVEAFHNVFGSLDQLERIVVPCQIAHHWFVAHVLLSVRRMEIWDGSRVKPPPLKSSLLKFIRDFVDAAYPSEKSKWEVATVNSPAHVHAADSGLLLVEFTKSLLSSPNPMDKDAPTYIKLQDNLDWLRLLHVHTILSTAYS